MKTIKCYMAVALLLLFTNLLLAQAGPPAMAMPNDSNTVLIDKIIEVTGHEQYFIDYCHARIINFAKENNWTSEKEKEILASVKFKYYNSTIYNSYAFFTNEQLKKLVEALMFLNNDRNNKKTLVLTNSMMQGNLDLFVESAIAGKYVTKNDK